jgi:hypothetical protein
MKLIQSICIIVTILAIRKSNKVGNLSRIHLISKLLLQNKEEFLILDF